MNIVILHGGQSSKQEYHCDFNILDMDTLNWIEVACSSRNSNPRAEHVSIISSNQLLIFGGINDKNYLGAEIYLVSLG